MAIILDATERAAGLTTQLLAYGQRGPIVPTTFSLSEELRRLETLMTRTLGPKVEIAVSCKDASWIHADRGQMGQVVMNLVFNARDAMPEGGRVSIVAEDVVVTERAVDRKDLAPGAWVALRVSDTGHGMSPEVQARMFEAFFTTRGDRPGTSGTGLGLSTVARIVKDAAGHIDVESAEGNGTTVTVWLPRVLEPVRRASPRPPGRATSPATSRVLVVEDEPSVRMLVGTVLMGAGYWVAVARDASEALAIVEKEAAFDLVVTDLLIAGHRRGGGFARRIAEQEQEHHHHLRACCSCPVTTTTRRRSVLYGPLLRKPFHADAALAARSRSGVPRHLSALWIPRRRLPVGWGPLMASTGDPKVAYRSA